jgi:hypothetical protein
MRRRFAAFCLGSCALGAVALAPRPAHALIDLGVEAVAQQRTMGTDTLKLGWGVQANLDVMLLPQILKMGIYGYYVGNNIDAGNVEASQYQFITGGLRFKGTIPLEGPFHPFGVIGGGVTHVNLPDATVDVCAGLGAPSQVPTSQIAACNVKVPNAEATFFELSFGVGFAIDIAGPLQLVVEGDWKPTFGYSNDVYNQALHQQSQNPGGAVSSPGNPSRNGTVWTGLAGLGLSF